MRCGTIQYSIVWRNCYRLESSHAIMTLYYVLGSPNLISAHRISTLTTIPVDHSHPTTLQKQHYQTIKLVFLYNCTARYRTVHIMCCYSITRHNTAPCVNSVPRYSHTVDMSFDDFWTSVRHCIVREGHAACTNLMAGCYFNYNNVFLPYGTVLVRMYINVM